MKRPRLAFAVVAVLAFGAIGGPLLSGSAAASLASAPPAPVTCDPPGSSVARGDIRDQVCATALTASGPRITASAISGVAVSLSTTPSGVTNLSVSVPNLPDNATNDELVGAGGNGATTVQAFPPSSLVANFPGNDTYNSSLPIGILTLPPSQASAWHVGPSGVTSSARSPSDRTVASRAPAAAPSTSTSGLTCICATVCAQASSNSDGSNTTGAAFFATCWDRYKFSDSSNTYNYRLVWSSSGSAHGGNFSHHLDQAQNQTDYEGSSNNLTNWSPDQSQPYSSCQQVTVGLGLTGAGVNASISSTFNVCPDRFGIQFVDLPSDRYYFGWEGNKGCGGGSCDYIGIAGGSEDQILSGSLISYNNFAHIAWSY